MKILFLLTLIIFTSSCGTGGENNPPKTHSGELQKNSELKTQKEINEDIVKARIETIRKRLALKGFIIQGDSYFRDGQLPLALKKYQNFYKENPNDDLIKIKIADTYFEMKKYKSAKEYYSQVEKPDETTTERLLLSLWYTTNLDTPALYPRLIEEIKKVSDNKEVTFYSETLLGCISNFHTCKIGFQEYFWPEETEKIIEGEYEILGEENGDKKINYNKLLSIKEAIDNYRNFGIDDVTLKDAYIVGALYKDEMYTIAIKLSEKILEERPGYKPIVKIMAQSHFHLGNYDTSRKMLGEYYENDDDDAAVSYMLGVTNTKLREYVLANIYFSKSLALGYSPSVNAYRQLIHNYYLLKDEAKIRSTFKDMVKFESEIEDIDLALGIYYHILGEEYITALKWSKMGQEKFPENSDFYGYEGWIYREQWKNEASLEILNKALELDSNNPFVIINLGYSENQAGNTGRALVYFKKVLRDFADTEFGDIAKKEITELSE